MDNLTHSLFAMTLARTRPGKPGAPGRHTAVMLVLSSNAPDIDIVSSLSGGPGAYLAAHRGLTHALPGAVLLSVACAAIIALVDRVRDREGPGFSRLFFLAAAGVTFHILMDLPTSYGTRILLPFSTRWYAFDWMPIIDVYLLLVLALTWAWGRVRLADRSSSAYLALMLMAGNYALHATAHAVAVGQAGGTARWRVASWSGGPPAACRDAPCASIAAIPTFLSPFQWRIIRPIANGYDLFTMDIRTSERSATRTIVNEQGHWNARAADSGLGSEFLRFARFPAASSTALASGGTTVRIQDVRFAGSPIAADDTRSPFVVLIDIDPSGRITRERLGR